MCDVRSCDPTVCGGEILIRLMPSADIEIPIAFKGKLNTTLVMDALAKILS